jgi:hypothetical protein
MKKDITRGGTVLSIAENAVWLEDTTNVSGRSGRNHF